MRPLNFLVEIKPNYIEYNPTNKVMRVFICESCQTQVSDSVKYCTNCGNQFLNDSFESDQKELEEFASKLISEGKINNRFKATVKQEKTEFQLVFTSEFGLYDFDEKEINDVVNKTIPKKWRAYKKNQSKNSVIVGVVYKEPPGALIDVSKIVPEAKDKLRADNLGKKRERLTDASLQAVLISDLEKLVRRSKAVVDRWGTKLKGLEDPWGPFKQALEAKGFTPEQIKEIENYKS